MAQPSKTKPRRKICFVTGSRAEFGLMHSTLSAIRDHPRLQLQVVVTGMHLDRSRGNTIDETRRDGGTIDARVPWRHKLPRAQATGHATAELAATFARLHPDVLLIVGDRVEALAAATAGHLCDIPVAHVHGGDRAVGQADDSLRHAITKLAHVHFPATPQSARRLLRLGEDRWRIHRFGSPGIAGIRAAAATLPEIRSLLPGVAPGRFALLALHPVDPDDATEFRRARMLLAATLAAGVEQVVIIHPNNDPGSEGIARCWRAVRDRRVTCVANVPRPYFLGLLRDAAFLVGNSSSGIIEAASFGTPVIDVGPRQAGREHAGNVVHSDYDPPAIKRAMDRVWRGGHPRKVRCRNPYGGTGTGTRIAELLAVISLDRRLLRKLIAY